MKLITTATELEKEFRRLTIQYENFYWTTAWASSKSNLFNDLLKNRDKIKKIVVGIHFYQTDPDFIEHFLNHKKVRFIHQPEGTFHPKLYLFSESSKKWELIIGSANFTKQAFSRNTEASILLSDKDSNSTDAFRKALKLVDQSFSEGEIFNKTELEKYRTIWENHSQKIKSLSGQYGSDEKKPKPIFQVAIITRNWDDFMSQVKIDKSHGLDQRIKVIGKAKELFSKVRHFNALNEDERKFIAGIPNKLKVTGSIDWGFFGSMSGAGVFKNRIIENNKYISQALQQIPLSGKINKIHYENFIRYYKKAFSGSHLEDANNLATATRLLCMKRPDTFVCIDSKNRSSLCKDFGILQKDMNYERYWDEIIERIYDSEWWQNPKPKNDKEEKVCEARSAFLDSIYFEK